MRISVSRTAIDPTRVEVGEAQSKTVAEYSGDVEVRQLDNSPHFPGTRVELRVYDPKKKDSDGDPKLVDWVSMVGATLHLFSATHYQVDGFVEVDSEGNSLRPVRDDHTGLYRREIWYVTAR